MTKQLDELAKSLASGMPRRKALKLFLAGLVGAAVAPEVTFAAKVRRGCPPGLIPCGNLCCPPGFCVHVNGNQLLCVAPNGAVPICPPGQMSVNGTCIAVNGTFLKQHKR